MNVKPWIIEMEDGNAWLSWGPTALLAVLSLRRTTHAPHVHVRPARARALRLEAVGREARRLAPHELKPPTARAREVARCAHAHAWPTPRGAKVCADCRAFIG